MISNFLKRNKDSQTHHQPRQKHAKRTKRLESSIPHSASSPEINPALKEFRRKKLKSEPEDILAIEVAVQCRGQVISNFNPSDYEVESGYEKSNLLKLRKGEIIDVVDKDESGWWEGISKGKLGVFPSTYIHVIDCFSEEDCVVKRAYIERDNNRILNSEGLSLSSSSKSFSTILNIVNNNEINGDSTQQKNEKQEENIIPVNQIKAKMVTENAQPVVILKREVFDEYSNDNYENSIAEVISDILSEDYTHKSENNTSGDSSSVTPNIGYSEQVDDISESLMNEISELQFENSLLKIKMSTMAQDFDTLKYDFQRLKENYISLSSQPEQNNNQINSEDNKLEGLNQVNSSSINEMYKLMEGVKEVLQNHQENVKLTTIYQSQNRSMQQQLAELTSLYESEKKNRLNIEEKFQMMKRDVNDYKILNQNLIDNRNLEIQIEINNTKEEILKLKVEDKITYLKTLTSNEIASQYEDIISDLQNEIKQIQIENIKLRPMPRISESHRK